MSGPRLTANEQGQTGVTGANAYAAARAAYAALDLLPAYACFEARVWVEARGDATPEQLWYACHRGDWLLWLAARLWVERRLVIEAACDCAEGAWQYAAPESLLACAWAIDAARRYARGETDLDELEAARVAAYAATARAAAAAGAYADAYAATARTAAAYAADAAGADADAYAAAAYAATARAAAAYAADADAAYADAYAASLAHSADLVRKRIPWAAVAAAIDMPSPTPPCGDRRRLTGVTNDNE